MYMMGGMILAWYTGRLLEAHIIGGMPVHAQTVDVLTQRCERLAAALVARRRRHVATEQPAPFDEILLGVVAGSIAAGHDQRDDAMLAATAEAVAEDWCRRHAQGQGPATAPQMGL